MTAVFKTMAASAVTLLAAFMLACGGGGGGGSTSDSPSIAAFAASPPGVASGHSATLTASFSGGTGKIDNGVGTVSSGTPVTVTPSVTTTYTLTVTGTSGQTVTATAVVTVTSITSFVALPASIDFGQSAALTAVFAGGTGEIDNGVGTVTSGTPVTVTPSVTTTYTLTATGAAGQTVTKTAVVTVGAPTIVSFTAAPTSISLGDSATLTAVFSGGTGSVDNSVGTVTSGTPVTVTPTTTTTYTLRVTNGTTYVESTATITVGPWIDSFSAAPTTAIASGANAVLTFSFNGTGTIDNGVGAVTSGTPVVVAPTVTTTYTLTVTGAGTKQVTVLVGDSSNPSLTISIVGPLEFFIPGATITNSSGFNQVIDYSTTLADLTPGTYTVTGHNFHDKNLYPHPFTQDVVVTTGNVVATTIEYMRTP